MKVTLQEQYINALINLGEREVKRTHKKIVFSRKEGGHYYLGKSGSLRVGYTVAGSIPGSSKLKERLLNKAVDNPTG